jgi:phosphoenolpyruvate---glycerone phosphotransferase subunit DhaL
MPDTIGFNEIIQMIQAAGAKIRANQSELTRLDSAIGDGDHGTTVARAMDAADKVIQEFDSREIKTLLKQVGWGVMGAGGGAGGSLLGSFFMGMSDGIEDQISLNCNAVVAMFVAGLAKLEKQSKARIGDKTMMDALIPAVGALQRACSAGKSIKASFEDAYVSAHMGAVSTKDLRARYGRAKNLGDRTLGCQDPGATSIVFIFEGFLEALI